MDFSEIGVKSRKTGLTARENVRRDEHDMEDLDDFFREEQTTLVNESSTTKPPNGRIIFPPSNNDLDLGSPTGPHRNSPLLSPLPSRSQRPSSTSRGLSISNERNSNEEDDDSEQFDDANENPPMNDDSDMEIDNESRGDIKVLNNNNNKNDNNNNDDYSIDLSFGEDTEKVYPGQQSSNRNSRTPTNTPRQRNTLFVQDYEEGETIDSIPNQRFSDRRSELERNMTIRSSARKPISSRRTTPSDSRTLTPTRLQPSSSLKLPKEPSRPSSKSIASLSKNLALNKKSKKPTTSKRKPRTPSPQRSGSSSDYEDDGKDVNSGDEEDDILDDTATRTRISSDISDSQSEPSLPTLADDFDDELSGESSDEVANHSLHRANKKVLVSDDSDEEADDDSRNNGEERANKFKRSAPGSPSKKHVIDVKRLRKAQESRSRSRPQVEQPTRRSSRVRIPPLAFWRNEKAVYEKSRGDVVPTLKKIITVDEAPQPTRSRMPSRATSRKRNTSKTPQVRTTSRPHSKTRTPNIAEIFEDVEEEDEDEDEDERAVANSEYKGSEWLKNGFLKIDTFEAHGSDVKADRLIAWAPGTENFSSSVVSATDNFKLAILFDKNRDFIATGMMLIPPGGVKSLKSTDSTYFVFYCISGIIEVTLSGSVFLIKKGCSLEVPMGNFYQFVNKGKKDATLFFVQTRGNPDESWEE